MTLNSPHRWGVRTLASCLVLFLVMVLLAPVAGATTSSYSIDRTVSVSPSTFAGATSGGDGYDLAFYGDRVFNVFHHEDSLQVMCVNRIDGTPCLTASGVPVVRTVSSTVMAGLSGSFTITDVYVNADGTVSVELLDDTSWMHYDPSNNPLLQPGMAISLSGLSPDVDGTYHIASVGTSIHDRELITTSDTAPTGTDVSYCSQSLVDGYETMYSSGQVFSDTLTGGSCDSTWTGQKYLRFEDYQSSQISTSFVTSAKPTLYVDQTTGFLFVPAMLDLNSLNGGSPNAANDSYMQPGMVCIDLNAYLTSDTPGCGEQGGPSTWTPLGALNDVSWFAVGTQGGKSPSYGLGNMVEAGGKLWVFNPVSHAGQSIGSTVNALLCFDPVTATSCGSLLPDFGLTGQDTSTFSPTGANELSLANDLYGTPFGSPEPATSIVSVGSRIYITMDAIWYWNVGVTSYRHTAVACVDVSEAGGPVNCDGSWPVMASGTPTFHSSIPPIPYLSPSGAIRGICFDRTGTQWFCVHTDGTDVTAQEFDATQLQTPLAQPNVDGYGSGYSPSPVVIGTKVFVSQLRGGSQVACFDFATNASCVLGSGTYPKILTSLTAPYAIAEDPQIPGCIWVNSDGGSSRATNPTIVNFDSQSGGSCTYEGSLATIDFVTNREGCQATSVSDFTITTNAANRLRSASVTVSATATLGTVPFTLGGSTDLTAGSGNPSANFSTLNSAIEGTSNLVFHVHLATTSSSNLDTVTVHMSWSATRAGCDQPLPSAPRSVTGTGNSGSASIAWLAPSSGPTPSKYTVTIAGHGSCVVDLVATPQAPLTCTIAGLTNGVTYSASVVAETVAGTSTAVTATVTPHEPSVRATPFKDYVHGWSYSGSDLTPVMKANIRGIAVRVIAQHCTKVTLTGYANFTALPSLSRKRAQAVGVYLRSELNRRGGQSVTITIVVGGSTDKYVKTVLNRAVVVQAR